MSKIQIHLPKPCHEDWHAMTIEEKGRFCQACQKTVYDFTKKSDRQILAHLNADRNTCGRFLATQLDRNLIVAHQKNNIWTAGFAGFISLFVLASNEVSAQTKQESVHTYRAKYNRESATQKVEKLQSDSIPIKIIGTVVESGLPVPAVNVCIKGRTVNTQTDFDGHFSIGAHSGDTLRISFIGYKDYEMVVTQNQNNVDIEIQLEPFYLGGDVVFSGAISRTTFFGRLYNRVRNLFREE
jgi:hypothetical protein